MSVSPTYVFLENIKINSPGNAFIFCFELATVFIIIFFLYMRFFGITRKIFIAASFTATVFFVIFTNFYATARVLKIGIVLFAVVCFMVEIVLWYIRYGYKPHVKKDSGTSILALDEFKDEVCVPEGENIAGINMTYAEIRKAQKAIVKLNRKDGYESEIRSANKIIDSFYVYSAKTKNDFVPKETYDNIKNMRKHLEKLVLNTKNKKEN